MMDDTDALRWRVDRLQREMRELRAAFVQLSRRRDNADARLGAVLEMIFAFAHDKPWTVGELIEDARRGDRALWGALDAIVGDRGNPAIRLGRWLERHDGVEVDGLRLVRVKREGGAWLYAVESVV